MKIPSGEVRLKFTLNEWFIKPIKMVYDIPEIIAGQRFKVHVVSYSFLFITCQNISRVQLADEQPKS